MVGEYSKISCTMVRSEVIDMLKIWWDKINGYKSYIISGAVVIYAILGASLQLHGWERAVELILGALGLGAVAHKVDKMRVRK